MPQPQRRAAQLRAQTRAAALRQQQQQQAALAAARKRAEEQQKWYQRRQQQQQQQARQAADAARQAQAARGQAQADRRIQRARQRTHVVRKGDTAEGIASQYGIEPAEVAGKVKRLRPGQRITLQDRTAIRRGIEDRARQQPAAPTRDEMRLGLQDRVTTVPEGGVGAVQPAIAAPTLPIAARMLQALPTLQKALARFDTGLDPQFAEGFPRGSLPGTESAFEQTFPISRMTMAEADFAAGYPKGALPEGPGPADLSKWNELRRPPGGIHEQMEETIEEAKLDKSLFAQSMRYTGQALAYAWEAMTKGDEDWKRFLSDSEGNVVMYITEGDLWDSGPMKDQFSPEMWNKVEEMGFVEIETGLWMMGGLEPADYGMGGYTYPGYGGLGGFAGGDYEYLARGGQLRRKRGGGVSTGDRYRIFPEGISPSHWRI